MGVRSAGGWLVKVGVAQKLEGCGLKVCLMTGFLKGL